MCQAMSSSAYRGPWLVIKYPHRGQRLAREIQTAVDASWKAHVNKGRTAVVQGLKAFLDDKGFGPWHCLLGPLEFVVAMRYHKERLFVLDNPSEGIKCLVYQSPPLSPPPQPSEAVEALLKCAEPLRLKCKVLQSSMDEALQAWTMTVVEKAIDNSKAEDMAPTAALIREAVTQREGPLWHVVLSRSPEVGLAVEASPGSLLDVRVHKYRLVMWRHHLDLRLLDRLLTLRGGAAVLLVAAIVCFSNYCQRRRMGCGSCCLEADPTACEDGTVLCGESEVAAAHACLRVKQLMLTCACTLMFGGLFLNIAAKGREVQLPRTRPQNAHVDGRKKKRR